MDPGIFLRANVLGNLERAETDISERPFAVSAARFSPGNGWSPADF